MMMLKSMMLMEPSGLMSFCLALSMRVVEVTVLVTQVVPTRVEPVGQIMVGEEEPPPPPPPPPDGDTTTGRVIMTVLDEGIEILPAVSLAKAYRVLVPAVENVYDVWGVVDHEPELALGVVDDSDRR